MIQSHSQVVERFEEFESWLVHVTFSTAKHLPTDHAPKYISCVE